MPEPHVTEHPAADAGGWPIAGLSTLAVIGGIVLFCVGSPRRAGRSSWWPCC
jgi:hypothetical protein